VERIGFQGISMEIMYKWWVSPCLGLKKNEKKVKA
jgi:hypothetical protein